MVIQESTRTTCPKCNHVSSSEEIYGCDECKKTIGTDNLEISVFYHGAESRRMQFCSWACAFKALPKVKTDYFIDLPYLTFDSTRPGLTADDFFAAIRKFK